MCLPHTTMIGIIMLSGTLSWYFIINPHLITSGFILKYEERSFMSGMTAWESLSLPGPLPTSGSS